MMDGTIFIRVCSISVDDRLRTLNQGAVERLKESITRIGLKTPISVRPSDEQEEPWTLIAGRHRLQACIELGFEKIEAQYKGGTDVDYRLWEIAENLHRAELTVAERSRHVAEWIRLTEENNKPAQVAPVSPKGGRGHEGGINAAARELGIDRTEAQRAVKIDSLTDEAKATAVATGLDDNQSALLAAAKENGAEAQVAALKERAAKRRASGNRTIPASPRTPETPEAPDMLPVASVKENEPGTEFPELAEDIKKEGASDRLARAVNSGAIEYFDARKLLKKTPEAQARAIEKAEYKQRQAQYRVHTEAAVQLLADRLAAKDFARFIDLLERTDFFGDESVFSEALIIAGQSRGLLMGYVDCDDIKDEPQEAA
jgi:ParB-like chromosome segregation protein Spo0J